MAYPVQRKIDLRRVCPEHTPLSAAPSYAQLVERAEGSNMPLAQVLHIERFRRYSALDRHGNVVLCQNPAAWAYEECPKTGRRTYLRQSPQFVCSAADAAKARTPIAREVVDNHLNI